MSKKKESIFWQKAVEHLVKQDDLSAPIEVIKPKWWLMLITSIIITIAIVVWSFLGTISTRVEGNGLLLTANGKLFSADVDSATGQLTRVTVQRGESIKKDQKVATIKSSDLNKQFVVTNNHLNNLFVIYNHHKKISQQDLKKRESRLEQQNVLLQRTIESETKHLKKLENLLEKLKGLHKKGHVSKLQIVSVEQNYYAAKREIQSNHKQINQNKMEVENFKDKWLQRLRDLELKIKESELELRKLKEKLALSKFVTSPVDGVVISVNHSIGDHVKPGDAIVTIASANQGIDAVLFVLPKDGKQIKIGMHALISPENVKKEEYGSIVGKVTQISDYPISKAAMISILHNKSVVEHFAKESPAILVRVNLKNNPKTFSKLRWTTSSGPSIKITPGTLVSGRITVKKQAPISLLLPMLKKIIGMDKG